MRATLRLALCGTALVMAAPVSIVVAQQDPSALGIPQIVIPAGDAEITFDQPAPATTALSIDQPPETTTDRCAAADAAITPGCDPQVVLIAPPALLVPDTDLSREPGGVYIRLGGAQSEAGSGQDIGAIIVTTQTPPPALVLPEEPAESAIPFVIESTVPFVVESVR